MSKLISEWILGSYDSTKKEYKDSILRLLRLSEKHSREDRDLTKNYDNAYIFGINQIAYGLIPETICDNNEST